MPSKASVWSTWRRSRGMRFPLWLAGLAFVSGCEVITVLETGRAGPLSGAFQMMSRGQGARPRYQRGDLELAHVQDGDVGRWLFHGDDGPIAFIDSYALAPHLISVVNSNRNRWSVRVPSWNEGTDDDITAMLEESEGDEWRAMELDAISITCGTGGGKLEDTSIYLSSATSQHISGIVVQTGTNFDGTGTAVWQMGHLYLLQVQDRTW